MYSSVSDLLIVGAAGGNPGKGWRSIGSWQSCKRHISEIPLFLSSEVPLANLTTQKLFKAYFGTLDCPPTPPFFPKIFITINSLGLIFAGLRV